MAILKYFRVSWNALLDVFYPNLCQICTVNLHLNERFVCLNCTYDLPYIEQGEKELQKLQKLFWGRVEVKHVFSLLNYQRGNQTQKLLHQLKYRKKTKLGTHFGEVLGGLIPQNTGFDLVLPVPLHPKKQKLRGFNQSTIIANGISKIIKVPVLENGLRRNAFNESQTKFSKYDRWENVRHIFSVGDEKVFQNKHVLLVDDVLTTGATIEACVRELLKVKNCSVSIATLAARV